MYSGSSMLTTLSPLHDKQGVLIYAAHLPVFLAKQTEHTCTCTFTFKENHPMSPIVYILYIHVQYIYTYIYIYMCINSPHPQLVYGSYVLTCINTFYLLINLYYYKYFIIIILVK